MAFIGAPKGISCRDLDSVSSVLPRLRPAPEAGESSTTHDLEYCMWHLMTHALEYYMWHLMTQRRSHHPMFGVGILILNLSLGLLILSLSLGFQEWKPCSLVVLAMLLLRGLIQQCSLVLCLCCFTSFFDMD